jgi:hypothetical protein
MEMAESSQLEEFSSELRNKIISMDVSRDAFGRVKMEKAKIDGATNSFGECLRKPRSL